MRAAEPFDLGHLPLRNRLVGTAHGRGILEDGLPLPEDAEYWRRRAAGGVAMLTVGGTVVAPESTWRRRITTDALACKRPGTGMSPMRIWELVGRPARRDFAVDEQIEP